MSTQEAQARNLLGLSIERCPLPERTARERREQWRHWLGLATVIALFVIAAWLEGRA